MAVCITEHSALVLFFVCFFLFVFFSEKRTLRLVIWQSKRKSHVYQKVNTEVYLWETIREALEREVPDLNPEYDLEAETGHIRDTLQKTVYDVGVV